jgi:hypothetical protein
MWRQTLPFPAERCKDWHYRPTCHHVAGLREQSKHDIEDVFCTCGCDFVLEGFVVDVPNWTGFVTTAAISPNLLRTHN